MNTKQDQEQTYETLNQISNDEFESIMPYRSPIEKYLDIDVESNIESFDKKISQNHYEITTRDKKLSQEVFVKYIPLIDYLKYLIGKYKKDNIEILPRIGDEETKETKETKYEKYINDKNNYAYVDSFFYYLTSKLYNTHDFCHGIQCFDSFVCQKKKCRINIADDFEYLCDSQYFNEQMGKLFDFEDEGINDIFKQSNKEPLKIHDDDVVIDIDDIEIDHINDEENDTENEIVEIDTNPIRDDVNEKEIGVVSDELEEDTEDDSDDDDDDSEDDSDDDEDDDSEYSESEEVEEESNQDEEYDESEEDDDSDDDEEEDIYLQLNKFPTQVVIMEKCTNTLDNLLQNDLITIEELESCMFQVISMLYVYQKVFHFTHNDLHTNNIMYVETDKEFIYYEIKGKTYKIPTFGKIYKIIDFGRAIYEYKGKLLCSDSFSCNGTAHTQYNFGPYYNNEKPEVRPNYSFDLCRLACSIFDFVCDDVTHIQKIRDEVPVYDLIFSWIYDDNNRNVLYKSNGSDKYPGFKLYRMITRIVHRHIPEDQFDHPCFNKYQICVNEKNKEEEIEKRQKDKDKSYFIDTDKISI